MKQVVDEVLATEGRIDVLVNKAGFGQFGPLMDINEVQLQEQLCTNVIAPLLVAQQVAPAMRAQGAGLIVNVGSVSGRVATPFAGAYCAPNAALHSLSEVPQMELAPFGIQVVTVEPRAIASNFGVSASGRLKGVLKPDSWYIGLAENIRERTGLSQAKATPAEEFARQLVAHWVQPNLPTVIRLGKKSRWLSLLKQILPAGLMAFMLKRRFGLLGLE